MRDEEPTDERQENAVSDGGEMAASHERAQNRESRRSVVADGGLQLDDFLGAIASRRRRYVLYYLRDEGRSTLDEVAEEIAARNHGTSPGEVDEQVARNVRINLYHAQVPKLAEAEIITYDRRNRTLSYNRPPEPVEEFLDYCASVEWSDTTER